MKYLKYQDCLLWYSLKTLSTGHYTHLCSYLATTLQRETIQKCFKRCRRSASGLIRVDAHAVSEYFAEKQPWHRRVEGWEAVTGTPAWKVTDWCRSWRGSQAEVCGEANGYRATERVTSAHLCTTALSTGTDPVVSVEILFLSHDTEPPNIYFYCAPHVHAETLPRVEGFNPFSCTEGNAFIKDLWLHWRDSSGMLDREGHLPLKGYQRHILGSAQRPPPFPWQPCLCQSPRELSPPSGES